MKAYRSSYFLLFITVVYGVASPAWAITDSTTNSNRYQWLESDSPARSQFVQSHADSADAQAKADPNYADIEYWLFQLYDVPRELKRVNLDATHSVILRENGLGKSTDLVLDSPDGEAMFVSDAQLPGATQVNIVGFSVSPDKKSVFAVTEQNGSIDPMQVQVYDIASQKALGAPLLAAENSIAWFSPTSLIFDSIDPLNNRFLSQVDFEKGLLKMFPNAGVIADGTRYVLFSDGKNDVLHDKTDLSDMTLQCSGPTQIVAEDALGADVWCQGDSQLGEIRSFLKSVKGTQSGALLIGSSTDQPEKPIRAATQLGQDEFVMVRNGADRWVNVYDFGTPGAPSLLGQIQVPDCCSISLTTLAWVVPGQSLVVTLSSAVVASAQFTYDLRSNSWDRDPGASMLELGGVDYKTEVVSVTSHDGAQVPLRLTYRADLKADGSHPVYFSSYGGFGVGGYLDPAFNKEGTEFMRRGGILADPGLRGGNEFGPSWHQQAMNQLKINTFYDLRASAQWVVQHGWATPAKVISTGTSNGGLTVAATALLFPNDFGLVIPISSVEDFLGKERMDPLDDGWDEEYGNALDPKAYPSMLAISPVENAKNLGSLRFLILDGLDDTRVNHAHSLKLEAALEDLGGGSPGQATLASFNEAGHWLADFYYQNTIAWHANVLVWTAIFKQAGWSF